MKTYANKLAIAILVATIYSFAIPPYAQALPNTAGVEAARQQAQQQNQLPPGNSQGSDTCVEWTGINFGGCMKLGLAWFGQLLVWLFGIILWIAGHAFDLSMRISILDFKNYAGDTVFLREAWAIGRDFANMFFIFIVLYIAIGQMLHLSKIHVREMLTKVLLVAIFINFSFAVPRVIIDASNIATMAFYNAIVPEADQNGAYGPGGILVSRLSPLENFTGTKFINPVGAPPKEIALDTWSIIVNSLGAVVVMLVASFVFFAGAILFAIRTLSFIFLIILAPLAFFAILTPRTQEYYKKWWDKLLNQAFFAPAFMFCLYFVFKFTENGGLLNKISGSMGGSGGAASASGIINTLDLGAALNAFMYFMILMGLLIGAILISTELGAIGAGIATSAARTATTNLTRGIGYGGFGKYLASTDIGKRVIEGAKGTPVYDTLATRYKQAQKAGAWLGSRPYGIGTAFKNVAGAARGIVPKTIESAEGVAAAAGVPFILAGKAEEMEAEKKVKEGVEFESTQKIKKINENILNMDRDEVEKLILGLSNTELGKLKPEVLANDMVSRHLGPSALDAIRRSGNLTPGQMTKIKDSIMTNGTQAAKSYLKNSPAQFTWG